MYIEKKQGTVGNAGHQSPVGVHFEIYCGGIVKLPATAEEITEARLDGVCPRCNKMIFIDPEGVYCPCGFSF